jgi:hypothetical protein
MSSLAYISHGNVRETRERYKKEKEEGESDKKDTKVGGREGEGRER